MEAEGRLFAAFADEVLSRQIALGKAPGGLLVVVAEGKALLLKGYGWADPAAVCSTSTQTSTAICPGCRSKPPLRSRSPSTTC
jgi:hypothetical protein